MPKRGAGFDPPAPRRSARSHYAWRLEAVPVQQLKSAGLDHVQISTQADEPALSHRIELANTHGG
ncbi:MAG TPA: hypothetical protein VN178_11330 [Rubrobacter sp.]|nr:hypothetical protein [Rubrobacter sp.]